MEVDGLAFSLGEKAGGQAIVRRREGRRRHRAGGMVGSGGGKLAEGADGADLLDAVLDQPHRSGTLPFAHANGFNVEFGRTEGWNRKIGGADRQGMWLRNRRLHRFGDQRQEVATVGDAADVPPFGDVGVQHDRVRRTKGRSGRGPWGRPGQLGQRQGVAEGSVHRATTVAKRPSAATLLAQFDGAP